MVCLCGEAPQMLRSSSWTVTFGPKSIGFASPQGGISGPKAAPGGVDKRSFFSKQWQSMVIVGRRGAGVPPGRLRARPPVVPGRAIYAASFARFRGVVNPPLAPLAAPGIRWWLARPAPPDPLCTNCAPRWRSPTRIVCARFSLFCAPSRLKIPTFGRRADDRRLPLMSSKNRACFGGYCMLMPMIAGEQPKPCRSAGGNPSSRSVRSNGRHSDGNATAPPDSAAVPVVFRDRHVFATRVRLCCCAGRSYPSHSTCH
jgi:hypothetical protein